MRRSASAAANPSETCRRSCKSLGVRVGFSTLVGFEVVAPLGLWSAIVVFVAGLILIVVEGFIGLGVGSRYPDYEAGQGSMYVTIRGVFIGYLAG